jgi:hypothetical protein
MKRLMCLGVGLAVFAFVAATAAAQAPAQDTQKGKTVSVTGCLAAGADAKSFTLNDAMPATAEKEQSKEAPKSSEMKTYKVTADESLKLTGHVGHKVTLTGTIEEGAGAATPGPAGTSGTPGGGKPAASLTATALKMVSPSCTP